jgi:hypothetical protein
MNQISRISRIVFHPAPAAASANKDTWRARLGIAGRYLSTYLRSCQNAADFASIQAYCLFMGHARSGGTLLGALLDAHPQAVIGDEVDIFPYLKAGFGRDQVFQMLVDRSVQQAAKGKTKPGREQKTYSYAVPGQWQGRYQQMRVIGNRKAGISTQRLTGDFALLDELRAALGGISLRVLAAIRNPYDTISTMHIRSGRPLAEGIEQYFANCATIQRTQKFLGAENVLAVRHEDFLGSPEQHLEQICAYLGLEADPKYVQDCTAILYRTPSASRRKVEWSPEMIDRVRRNIDRYEFLSGYDY